MSASSSVVALLAVARFSLTSIKYLIMQYTQETNYTCCDISSSVDGFFNH